jgi:hypothetical protein
MRVRGWVLAAVSIVLFFGGIALSSALGYWKTTSDKVPAVIAQGAYAGQADPMDIRGSYRFDDIAKNFSVPLEALARAFGVDNPSGFQVKELEKMNENQAGAEIGTASVRYFVALYVGIPVDAVDAADLPESAAQVLREKGGLTEAALTQLAEHTVKM